MESHKDSGLDDAILQVLHLTKFTKRANLREQLTNHGFYLKDRQLRKKIETMITEDHYSIGSCELGYWLILTPEDLDEARRQLQAKAHALSIRANCLQRNFFEGKIQAQLQLFA